MKLTVLVDNNTYIDQYYLGEPALSFYIEEAGQKILFDTGYSDVLLRNAEAMGIDLKTVEKIILSHGHNDHTQGLKFLDEYVDLKNKQVIAHPDCFAPKIYKQLDIGAPFTADELQGKTQLLLTKDAYKLSDRLYFLGEIERKQEFEKNLSIGKTFIAGRWVEDKLLDDSALVYQSAAGLFIITGCSHSGICNIITYAQKLFAEQRIIGVIGGLHLLQNDERSKSTIDFLQNLNLQCLYPCHCVSLQVKAAMCSVLPVTEVGVGLTIEI